MPYSQNIFLHVICEGKSERNYLAALNRLFRDSGIKLTVLCPTPESKNDDGGGHFKSIMRKYKEACHRNRHAKLWIWVDKDLYLRNDRNCMDLYQKKPENIPDFLFSVNNFEDFLVLHCSTDRVHEWMNTCRAHNHFDIPMHSKEYETLFKDQFPEYKKGELPDSLTLLTNEQIENALTHSLDDTILFRCDFIERLAMFIMDQYPDTGKPWSVVSEYPQKVNISVSTHGVNRENKWN